MLVLVTGASSGLGLETARVLAEQGAHVVAAVRDPSAAPEGSEVLALDLADLASVRRAASAFLERHDRLDVLVNNAGVMFTPFGRTTDGFELQFGTNHLGHFLLTQLLTPVLLASAPARIVNLSSAGHTMSDIDWDDPNYERRPYDKFEAYGQSKTANILFTIELERRLGPQGVHAYAVHPGMVATNLARHMSRDDLKAFLARRRPAGSEGGGVPPLLQPEEGAATTVWAATSAELEGRGGLYLADCAVAECAGYARDPDAARRLWDLSEALVSP
jgi:NAD(P)-dependent dehydrogenase (short-subunit alcohol dehydrogenase family)